MSTGLQKAANTARKLPEALALLDEKLLARLMAHAPLPEILENLCTNIEAHYSALLCSILLLEPDSKTLRNGASPSIPKAYAQAVDGLQIGPCAGSCGTAAYRRQPVIVSDIATDPLWADYRLPSGRFAAQTTVMQKPFSLDMLAHKVRDLLDERAVS